MLDEEKKAAIEQESQFVCDVWTYYLINYYRALIKAGFSVTEAMDLTRDMQIFKLIGNSRK